MRKTFPRLFSYTPKKKYTPQLPLFKVPQQSGTHGQLNPIDHSQIVMQDDYESTDKWDRDHPAL